MLFAEPSLVAEFAAEVSDVTRRMNQLEARRLFLLRKLDQAGVAHSDGARSMVDWTSTKLDVAPETARGLVKAARTIVPADPWLFEEMENGSVTLDRATATVRLMNTDASERVVDGSFNMSLDRVGRLTHQYRRVTVKDEQQTFSDRYFTIQPSLDESRWSGRFELPAVEDSIVDQAITGRADELRRQSGGDYFTRNQLQADALVMISQDSLDTETAAGTTGGMDAKVFVDLDRANETGGELGAELQYGPRVGPNVLDELLCVGSVQLVGLQEGKPIVTSRSASAIPPAVRGFVAWRDKGCTISGCSSRYRLQPHHIKHRAHHGDHDPDNLATLCWFHHHVAVHQTGFTLETINESGTFALINPGHDPPWD